MCDPADSQEAVLRFLADPAHPRLERAGGARRHRKRDRVPRRTRRLQGQAGGPVSVHGSLDARQKARGLRSGNRRQSRQRAGRLSRGAADRAQRPRLRHRRLRRNRRMGHPHAPLRREPDARQGRRAGGRIQRHRRQAGAGDPPRPRARPVAGRRESGARARNLYRAERRRVRRTAGPVPAGERPSPHSGFAPRIRDRKADAAGARSLGVRSPLSRRFAPSQHRARSTASRSCSTRSSFPTRSPAATCSTILRFC